MATSDAVLRRMSELTRNAWRDECRPGGSYDLTHRELLGLQQIQARLRGPQLGAREQHAIARMMHQLLNDTPHHGGWREPVHALSRRPPLGVGG